MANEKDNIVYTHLKASKTKILKLLNDENKFFKYLEKLPASHKYYGFDERLLKDERAKEFYELTIPEIVIMCKYNSYLPKMHKMGYDLKKKFFKRSCTFQNGLNYCEGEHDPVSTLLQTPDGAEQLLSVKKYNFFDMSSENLTHAIRNSFLSTDFSLICENIYSFIDDINFNISKEISDTYFLKVLHSIIKDKNMTESQLPGLVQFLNFIYDYIDFSDKKEEEIQKIHQMFMIYDHYTNGAFFNKLVKDFPENKTTLSQFFLRRATIRIQKNNKDNNDNHIVLSLLQNPNIDYPNLKMQSIFLKEQINNLTNYLIEKKCFYEFSFLIKNTDLYQGQYLVEYIEGMKEIPDYIKNYLYTECITNGVTGTTKNFDITKFKKESENFFVKNGASGYKALKTKIEQSSLKTIFNENEQVTVQKKHRL